LTLRGELIYLFVMTNELKTKITVAILNKVAEGLTVRQAIDAVLGSGTVDRVISDVWETANKGKAV